MLQRNLIRSACKQTPLFCRSMATVSMKTSAASTPLTKSELENAKDNWETFNKTEQEKIISQLNERQKLPWKQLSADELKTCWYISYGDWGPRKPILQKGDTLYIAKGVIIGLLAGIGTFALMRSFADEPVRTMNREWQLKSDEYLKSKNANPWGGYSQVQSK